MKEFLQMILKKMFVKQWVIGLGKYDIKEIIRSKKFDPEIEWISINTLENFHADPFPLVLKDGKLIILYEDFKFDDFYGVISAMEIDKDFIPKYHKVLLDTKSHLSYPFIFEENNVIYVFPEAAQSGKLTCYKYDSQKGCLDFVKEIINLPLLDSTILKYKGKYWLFATMSGEFSNSKLYIFYSDNLLGPYNPHPENPVKNSPNGARPAGNIIEIDGFLYRPAQNCEKQYGESITINKISLLNELNFLEEPYMLLTINKQKKSNKKIHTIHTINIINDLIVVDGLKWIFSPINQWKNLLRNIAYSRKLKNKMKTNNSK